MQGTPASGSKPQPRQMIQTYRIDISYDGTNYFGWQRQSGAKTIQGSLETALARIASKHVPVFGSGRTDAGVHALGQVAHFQAELRLPDDELLQALNGQIPKDIRVTALRKVSRSFHARKSAKSKVYQYRIVNSPIINPFDLRYVLHWPAPLEIQRMKEAAAYFVREDDFTPFSSNRLLDPVRTIFNSELRLKGQEIVYSVRADGFLRYMVRSIVGTLLEVGKGKIPPEKIDDLFKQKKRTHSSPTAPARGLCLLKVYYGSSSKLIMRASSSGER